MKRIITLLLGVLLLLTPAHWGRAEVDLDEGGRFVFYAVLEGCFEDGLATEDVDRILMKRGKETYFHFIYACPVCMATIRALQVYQARPDTFYGAKGPGGAFGHGLAPEHKKLLYSEKTQDRLLVIHDLVEHWVEHRLTHQVATAEERDRVRQEIKAMREKGMECLKSFKQDGRATQLAPAYVEIEECAVCNGAARLKFALPPAH